MNNTSLPPSDLPPIPKLETVLAECRLKAVLEDIVDERYRQDEKWGEQNHALGIWGLVLSEELGEANKDILEAWVARQKADGITAFKLLQNARAELIQAAAVIIATIEYIDRKGAAAEI